MILLIAELIKVHQPPHNYPFLSRDPFDQSEPLFPEGACQSVSRKTQVGKPIECRKAIHFASSA